MVYLPKELPAPDSEALAQSERLTQLIRAEITKNGGRIPFVRFMELALHAPGLGYYTAGSYKLGKEGDFVTAPEISPLFSQCIANQCYQILEFLGEGEIIEFGAGTGVMAAELLLELERRNQLPEKYRIVEISAELKARQQALLKQRIPHFFDRVEWLGSLPSKPIKGIILANEVLDAMPVHRFRVTDTQIQEFYVAWENDRFVWRLEAPSSVRLVEQIKYLDIPVDDYYDSEISLLLPAWIKSIGECLEQGLVLLVDYGFPRSEYYHPDRKMGTLMCHYRHRMHADPLVLVGLQDVTAHVDFSAIAESASGLQVSGYTTQAAFLLNCGLLEQIKLSKNNSWEINQQIQMLTSPSEMGELFKAIALTRGLEELGLVGFNHYNRLERL